jgi:hypothetical protein
MSHSHEPPKPSPTQLAVLALSGPDARTFLNGQCTQFVTTLAIGAETRAAILNPQGRVLAFVGILGVEDGLRLLLPSDLVETVRTHLARYVLRARVTLQVASATSADTDSGALARASTGTSDWTLGSIRLGEPDVTARTSGEWIAQMLNLDLIGAISFEKGCYTGQEIVARTQHLGRIKRRMARFCLPGTPPEVLDGLYQGDTKIAEVVMAAPAHHGQSECLAVTALDALHSTLTLQDGRLCTPAPLPYSISETT